MVQLYRHTCRISRETNEKQVVHIKRNQWNVNILRIASMNDVDRLGILWTTATTKTSLRGVNSDAWKNSCFCCSSASWCWISNKLLELHALPTNTKQNKRPIPYRYFDTYIEASVQCQLKTIQGCSTERPLHIAGLGCHPLVLFMTTINKPWDCPAEFSFYLAVAWKAQSVRTYGAYSIIKWNPICAVRWVDCTFIWIKVCVSNAFLSGMACYPPLPFCYAFASPGRVLCFLTIHVSVKSKLQLYIAYTFLGDAYIELLKREQPREKQVHPCLHMH